MVPKPTQHPEYYIRGGDLHLRVENILFRVHSYFFVRESKYWKGELAGPTSPGDGPLLKGQDDKNAIIIDEEKPDAFAQFLWVFYNRTYGKYNASQDDWIKILHFAWKWEFHEVKELAIHHLQGTNIDLALRIQLYQKNAVPDKYLFPLFVQLASRKELLGLEEARALGLETFVLIQQARERLRAQYSPEHPFLSPVRKDLKHKEVSDVVAATFKFTVKDIETASGPN